MQPPSDPLDSLLGRWHDATPSPSDGLESKTWRRIAIAGNASERKPGLLACIEAVFARPSFTAAFVAACVLLGLFIAESRTSRLHAERSRQVVQNYLRIIDPLVEAGVVDGEPSSSFAPAP